MLLSVKPVSRKLEVWTSMAVIVEKDSGHSMVVATDTHGRCLEVKMVRSYLTHTAGVWR